MSRSSSDSMTHPAANKRNGRSITFGILILSGVVLSGLIGYFGARSFKAAKAKSAAMQAQGSTMLMSVRGKVLVLKAGKTDWQEVLPGARLLEGDLIQTDDSGEASVRYSNGTSVSIPARTILGVQSTGNSRMEIVMPPEKPEGGTQGEGAPMAAEPTDKTAETKAGKPSRPFIILQRIVPYGRSLELIGQVESGSSLVLNSEQVIVGGDGSFKHFTKPFPQSAKIVHLVLKVTDLAGRSNTETVTYDFSPREDD
jgi:hypothetical protein